MQSLDDEQIRRIGVLREVGRAHSARAEPVEQKERMNFRKALVRHCEADATEKSRRATSWRASAADAAAFFGRTSITPLINTIAATNARGVTSWQEQLTRGQPMTGCRR